ncbi:MAG: VOC family protein [Candidatus Eremiobacteraeota bacterium]|nr:VOC family protein [Candidatus Eremiobacteraeota bacterium]
MQKIKTFLWFDHQAEEAVKFYCSLFEGSGILDVSRYGDVGPGEPGRVMTIAYRLAGQEFIALNGGPYPTGTPALSLFVNCKDQAEVDKLWDALLANGGSAQQCGWLSDKYGIPWQIIPERLSELLGDDDPERAQRAMEAMLKMIKIDVPALEKAAAGG